ncbi:MAG: ABC transporter ATP-binding protein [Burkholderiaceae bacterium]|nr:ABC transporter ATP-binding protein [Burkholderiaceae bacterium]
MATSLAGPALAREAAAPSGAAIAIEVRGLTKRFGTRTVVRDFDLRVPAGKIFGFLGPNGSGKTTTIRMLCGLLRADAGEGHCLGLDIRREAAAIKRQVGYMTQRFGLYEDLSIAENLDFVARIYGVRDRRARVEQTVRELGLHDRRDQLAGTLSGGWKQRLALAACLIHEPRLLLLDEPTAGVDPKARRDFWDHIHELAARGITVLVSTHYMDEAERCHSLAYIASGQLIAQGTSAEVIRDARLITWSIDGPGLPGIAERLHHHEAILSVAAFGNTLHASARSPDAIEQALDGLPADTVRVRRVEPSLEDVFIVLMEEAAAAPAAARHGD